MSTWKDRASFLRITGVPCQVNNTEVSFYPISIGLAGQLRGVIEPLARAIGTLTGKNENLRTDMGIEQRTVANDHGTFDTETKTNPIPTDLAALRHEQQVAAISSMVESLTSTETLSVLALVCMDSMRDVFPRGDKQNPPPAEFLNETPLPVLAAMVKGVLIANKGVFGPFGDSLSQMFDLAVAKTADALGNLNKKSGAFSTTETTAG